MKIKDTFVVVSSYNNDTEWIKEYTNNFVIFEKGTPREGTTQESDAGYNTYTDMKYIVDNYEKLPKTVMFIKGNIVPRHISKEEFDLICNNKTLTPILTQKHPVDGKINYYKDGLYYEHNNSWYFNHPDRWKHQHFHSYKEFADKMGLPSPEYLGFAPGGNWIVPRENILKKSKEFYQQLVSFVDYTREPAETHCIERSYFYIWS